MTASLMKRVRRRWYWARAMSHSGRGDVAKSMVCVQKLEAVSSLWPHEKAFKAALLIRNGEYDSAEASLNELATSTDNARGDNGRYVNLYAKCLLSELNGDFDLYEMLRVEARKLNPRPALKRWLPL